MERGGASERERERERETERERERERKREREREGSAELTGALLPTTDNSTADELTG